MFSRKLSPSEKTLLVADWASRPFANQIVVEGTGDIDELKLKKAVESACNAHPGSRLLLKGRSFFARWVATGSVAPVNVIHNSKWDGLSSENAPFLFEPLHPVKGPTSQVVLLPGDKTRIVFRTSHGTMDGRGTQLWAEDVFRALNNATLIGSNSQITDMDISAMTHNKPRNSSTQIRPNDCIVPTGRARGHQNGVIWKRIRVKGKFRSVVSRIAILLAREAWKYQDGKVSFLVPVDMRKRIPGLRSTNNLSSMIHFYVSKKDTVESVQTRISSLLKGQYESLPAWYKIISFVPMALMKTIYRQSALNAGRTGLYSASAIISNLGKIPMERYDCDGFKADSCFFVPPCGMEMSHFMTLSGSGQYVDILSATPSVYATDGRINKLLACVRNGLASEVL